MFLATLSEYFSKDNPSLDASEYILPSFSAVSDTPIPKLSSKPAISVPLLPTTLSIAAIFAWSALSTRIFLPAAFM